MLSNADLVLGINYKDIIDIKYQNRGYNFHTLLNALNSTVKSDIYKALTEKSPLSLVELNSCLHFHERIVRNHIREMIEAGFVVVAHELKRKKYYALNLALIKDILFCHQEDIKKLENLGA